MGDVIDGQNATKANLICKDANKSDEEKKSIVVAEALRRVKESLQYDKLPSFYNLIGNHELYTMSREQMQSELNIGVDKAWHAFEPHPSLRVILLDAYRESVLSADLAANESMYDMLKQFNPNDVRGPTDWAAGLIGTNRRWLPYNGAFGDEQRAFLAQQMQLATDKKQRVIVASHVPIGRFSCQDICLAWDHDKVYMNLFEIYKISFC